MKLVSIDTLTRQNQTANDNEGWTETHLYLRTLMENTPAAVAEFKEAINPRIEEMLRERQVVIIDEEEVIEKWREHGLDVPKSIFSPLALALTQPDGSHVMLFNIKGLREQGTVDLEQVVVHELTHVRQLEEGRLVGKDDGMYWEGVRYCPHSYVQQSLDGKGTHGVAYLQCLLPWELEAYTAAFEHAVKYDIPSSNRQLPFVLAVQTAYHHWCAGGDLKPCDHEYHSQVLSPYGYSRICLADRETMRSALLGDMTNMIAQLELSVKNVGLETAERFLTMDMERILRVFLGYGINTNKTTGFFKNFFEAFPTEMFTPQAQLRIKELIDAGK